MDTPKDIHARIPVDATAARVTSSGPKGLESGKRIVQTCSPTPLPTRPIPTNAPNLLGHKSGHLTVIGLSVRKKADGTALWVCRCSCGYFTERRSRSLLSSSDFGDRCDRCRQVSYLRRHETYRQLGYNPDET